MSRKIIIFDFDGVIVDSNEAKTLAFKEAVSDLPRAIQEEFIDYHKMNMGVSRFTKFVYLQEKILGVEYNPDDVSERCKSLSQYMMSFARESLEVFRDTLHFILSNRNDHPMYVASATEQEELRKICQILQIGHLFQGVFGSPKSKAAIIQSIVEKTGPKKNRYVLIGDSTSDRKAADEAGIDFWGIRNSSLLNYGNYITDYREKFIHDFLKL